MNDKYSPCLACRVREYDGDNDRCCLPLCILDAFPSMGYRNVDIETLVLWEKGYTIEDIKVKLGSKYRATVVEKITRWRDKKREAGLLV